MYYSMHDFLIKFQDYDFPSREKNMKTFLKTFQVLLYIFFSISLYSANYTIYHLKSGETLWRISKKFNISLDELCKINKITDVTKIKDGTKLKIPVEKKGTTSYSSKNNYQAYYLKAGETLWRVSKKYNINLEELCKINNINDVTKVYEGTKLLIPWQNNGKKYLNYNIPINGSIKPFVTPNFRGLLIFTKQKNEKVYAIDKGLVSYVNVIKGYGIVVYIKHDNGYMSTYSGFKEIYVKSGEKIEKNQTIGIAGQLSRYKKPGLLFSLIYNKKGLKFDMNRKKFFIN